MKPTSFDLSKRPVILISTAVLLRLILILISHVTSKPPFTISLTDIDYTVFTDAACSPSPYDRPTYRYTPFLAYLMKPNCFFWSFGKILFAFHDLVCAYLMHRLCRSHPSYNPKYIIWGWLLNPIVFILSSRGSFDSISSMLVLATFISAKPNRVNVLTALLLSMAVHLRIYPLIYGPCLTLYIGQGSLFTKRTLAFVTLCVVFFVSLCSLAQLLEPMYFKTGLLYHISGRVDHRHNMSPFWIWQLHVSRHPTSGLALGSFILQVAGVLIPFTCLWIKFFRSKPVALSDMLYAYFATTLLFVALNTVQTAQYFLWWITPLVPLLSINNGSIGVELTVLGLGCALGIELLGAALFEFYGRDSAWILQLGQHSMLWGSIALLAVTLPHRHRGRHRQHAKDKQQ